VIVYDGGMKTPRLYDDLAYLWPILSPPEHYSAEAAVLRGLIEKHFVGASDQRRSVLELGAGGGHTLVHLANDYDCTAVDLSDPMLANCRHLVPEVQTVVGDMRTLRLDKTYNAVFIHDAVDYMLSELDVKQALETAAEHLKPGGLCVIAPTYTRETFADGEVADDGTTTDSQELTYFSYVHDPDPTDDTFEMILLYLIRENPTRSVEVIEDRHTCGLFSSEQWLAWMSDAGFDARHEEAPGPEDEPWSLFAGVKR
jgi:SAM-dependent methyltransferase